MKTTLDKEEISYMYVNYNTFEVVDKDNRLYYLTITNLTLAFLQNVRRFNIIKKRKRYWLEPIH